MREDDRHTAPFHLPLMSPLLPVHTAHSTLACGPLDVLHRLPAVIVLLANFQVGTVVAASGRVGVRLHRHSCGPAVSGCGIGRSVVFPPFIILLLVLPGCVTVSLGFSDKKNIC